MAAAIPLVEVTDDADALRVRCPHGEARTTLAGMRAQLLMDVVVIALAEQVQIEIGERGSHGVSFLDPGQSSLHNTKRRPGFPQSTGLMPQILSAYSRMLRSLENGPMLSALMTDLRVHSSGFWNSASTRCWASR